MVQPSTLWSQSQQIMVRRVKTLLRWCPGSTMRSPRCALPLLLQPTPEGACTRSLGPKLLHYSPLQSGDPSDGRQARMGFEPAGDSALALVQQRTWDERNGNKQTYSYQEEWQYSDHGEHNENAKISAKVFRESAPTNRNSAPHPRTCTTRTSCTDTCACLQKTPSEQLQSVLKLPCQEVNCSRCDHPNSSIAIGNANTCIFQ